MITNDEIAFYQNNGYAVARSLFTADEVAFYLRHYMALREAGTYPGDFDGVDIKNSDPLKRFPRMIHMHRWDDASLQWLLDTRLKAALTALLNGTPYAVQSMLYFKPAGARGQALHQDNWYLRAKGGTCMAAWLALDDCDEENGCMQIVPGSHAWPILCPEKADTAQSFTDVAVPLPPDSMPQPVLMRAGDVLFFNGSIVHGSFPNTSQDRFRRSLIGHYLEGSVSAWGGGEALSMEGEGGTPVPLGSTDGSGVCGVWADAPDTATGKKLEMSGVMEPNGMRGAS